MHQWLEDLKFQDCPSVDECIDRLGRIFPLLLELRQTAQDGEWHGEGDVHEHTGLVLDELYALLRNHETIAGEQRQALILGALLHDIGKPLVSQEIERDGRMRIVAPRHEVRGRSYCAFRIMELPLPYRVIHTILTLIGEHNRPRRMVEDGRRNVFLRQSRITDLELLYLLELADMRGRRSPDRVANAEMLALFRLYAEEYGCWRSTPYHDWISRIKALSGYDGSLLDITVSRSQVDLEEGLIFTPEEAVAKSFRFRDGFPNVIVCCGLSGAGKSRYISEFLPGHDVVSLDALREELLGDVSRQDSFGTLHQTAKERLRESLRRQAKVVWDATGLRRDFRRQVIDLARDYNGLTTILFFHTTLGQARQGNNARNRQIPPEILARQAEFFEYPEMTEADRVHIVGHDFKTLWRHGFHHLDELPPSA